MSDLKTHLKQLTARVASLEKELAELKASKTDTRNLKSNYTDTVKSFNESFANLKKSLDALQTISDAHGIKLAEHDKQFDIDF